MYYDDDFIAERILVLLPVLGTMATSHLQAPLGHFEEFQSLPTPASVFMYAFLVHTARSFANGREQ